MMKITMDSLTTSRAGRVLGDESAGPPNKRRHDNEEKQHQDQPSERQFSRSLSVKEQKNYRGCNQDCQQAENK
jgi:hypothetical protein